MLRDSKHVKELQRISMELGAVLTEERLKSLKVNTDQPHRRVPDRARNEKKTRN